MPFGKPPIEFLRRNEGKCGIAGLRRKTISCAPKDFRRDISSLHRFNERVK